MIRLPGDQPVQPFVDDLNQTFDLGLKYVGKEKMKAALSKGEFATSKQLFFLLNKEENKAKIKSVIEQDINKKAFSKFENIKDPEEKFEALEEYLGYGTDKKPRTQMVSEYKDNLTSQKIQSHQNIDKKYISADKMREQFNKEDGTMKLGRLVETGELSGKDYKAIIRKINLSTEEGFGEKVIDMIMDNLNNDEGDISNITTLIEKGDIKGLETLLKITKEDLSYIIRSMEEGKLVYFLNAGLSEQLVELFRQDNHHSDHSEIENAIKFISWSKPLRIKKLLQTTQYKQLIDIVRTLNPQALNDFGDLIDDSIETVKKIFSANNEINIEEYLMNLPTLSIKKSFLKGLFEFHAGLGSPFYMQVLLSELYAPAVIKVVNEIGSANTVFLLKHVDRDILLTYLNSDDEIVEEFISKTKLYLRKHDLNSFIGVVNTKHRLPRR